MTKHAHSYIKNHMDTAHGRVGASCKARKFSMRAQRAKFQTRRNFGVRRIYAAAFFIYSVVEKNSQAIRIATYLYVQEKLPIQPSFSVQSLARSSSGPRFNLPNQAHLSSMPNCAFRSPRTSNSRVRKLITDPSSRRFAHHCRLARIVLGAIKLEYQVYFYPTLSSKFVTMCAPHNWLELCCASLATL